MGSFRDSKGAMWNIHVGIPSIDRVRKLAGVNLLDFGLDGKQAGIFNSLSDIVTFSAVIYAICKPEADSRGLTDEQFAECLDVDPDILWEALLDGIADFFQRRNQMKAADLVRWMMRKAKQAGEKIQATIGTDGMKRLDEAFDAALDEQLRKISESLSTSAEESSASIPGAANH